MRYTNPSICMSTVAFNKQKINKKIDDLRIASGRESHGVIAHEKTDF